MDNNNTIFYRPSLVEKIIIDRFKDYEDNKKYYLFKGSLRDGIEVIEKMMKSLKLDNNNEEGIRRCLFLCNLLYIELIKDKSLDEINELYVGIGSITYNWEEDDESVASAVKVYCDYFKSDKSYKIKEIVIDKKLLEEDFSEKKELDIDKYLVYQFFENKEYEKVIELCKDSLEKYPKETYFYFETVQAYIRLEKFVEAKAVLRAMIPYINNNSEKAKVYRNLGYISIEEDNLKLAMACYRCSLLFEDNSVAMDEVKYIILKDPSIEPYSKTDLEYYLRNEGLLYFSFE